MNHKRLAAWAWLSQLQYFVVQTFVTQAWNNVNANFSLRSNPISDLGNTSCGTYDGRYVCSPANVGMNLSFMLLGLTMLVGACLLMPKQNRRHKFGLAGLALGGLGTILVGLYPENVGGSLHLIGASLPFALGNIALLLLANHPVLPRYLQKLTYVSAIISLAGLIALLANATPGLGFGGVERLVAYPQTIWMIIFGSLLLRPSK